MKLSKLFLIVAIAVGMVACNSEDGPEVKGDSYAKVSVSLSGASTRAITDPDQEDNAGTADESGVSTVDMKSNLNELAWASGELSSSGTAPNITWSANVAKIAIPGAQQMALLLNKGAVPATNDPAAIYGASATAIADIAELTGAGTFLMTSTVMQYNVLPNITKTASETGSTINENVFGFDAERVVAKGIVAKGTGYSEAVTDGSGTVSDATFAAVNGATKTYVLRDHAGDRVMQVDDDNQYLNYTSAIDAITYQETATGAAAAGLVRLGNLAPYPDKTNADLDGYQAIAINETAANTMLGVAKGIYFLENSGTLTATEKLYGFYRYAYAKVYVTFTPAKVYVAPTDVSITFVEDATTGLWYLDTDPTQPPVTVATTGYTQGYIKYTNPLTETTTWTGTFYMGEKDGLFYSTKTAAASSATAPGQRAYTYQDGKSAYRALWNRQNPDDDVKLVNNADTRRNNIYVLNITSYAKIGIPYDPSDPNDPNLPKPDDPTEPIKNPDDPNIELQDTYMRVTAKVLPWNVVGREVVLQ